MSAIYERSVVEEYPGAPVIIPGDITVDDCAEKASLQILVKHISSGVTAVHPTSIVGGLAYTEGTLAQITTICTTP